jgi:hypothetical protein
MRALGFAQAREQISQQNLERYSKLFLQPLPSPSDSVTCSTLWLGGARGVLSYLCSGRPIQYIHGSHPYSLLECMRVELLVSADVCQESCFFYEH